MPAITSAAAVNVHMISASPVIVIGVWPGRSSMKRRPRRVAERARLIGWNKSKEGKLRYSRATISLYLSAVIVGQRSKGFPFDYKNPVIAETWATTETEREAAPILADDFKDLLGWTG